MILGYHQHLELSYLFGALFEDKVRKHKTTLSVPPQDYWCQNNRPGGSLTLDCYRQDQTTLTHFFSGHLRSLTYTDGVMDGLSHPSLYEIRHSENKYHLLTILNNLTNLNNPS
ncbi:hypothetical protein TNCV_1257251 [Trichonephila clavipes]|nr:hypothetical protein TNCV_1257251 [Trichonephila clavipes]